MTITARNYQDRRNLLVAKLWMTRPDETQYVCRKPGAHAEWVTARLIEAGYSTDRRSRMRFLATIRGARR